MITISLNKFKGLLEYKKVFVFLTIALLICSSVSLFAIVFFNQNSRITSISSSYFSSCYTNEKGELFVKGINTDGQLGTISGIISSPLKIETETKVKKAVLSLFSLAYIDENNDVFIMGIYSKENDKVLRTTEPKKLQCISDIVDIKSGATHFLALDSKGDVWAWGENECNQVSLNKNENSWVPKKNEGIHNVDKIECGLYTSCAISKESIVFWGEDCVQLTESRMFAGNFTLDIANVQTISIGRNHMVVLTEDDVLGYGSNMFCQLGKTPEFLSGESLNINSVQDVFCSITATIFLIDGKTYCLGDINPFDSEPVKSDLTIYNNKNSSIELIDGFSFQFVEADKFNVYYSGYSFKNKNIESDDKISVALLDTGVDDSLPAIKSVLSKNHTNEFGYTAINRWNFCDGNDIMVDDVLTDSHGTSMFGLIANCILDNGEFVSYDDYIEILPIKVLNSNGGRFVDILNAIQIVNSRNIDFVNCSFSIDNICYQNILENVVSNSDAFYLFSLSNTQRTNQVMLNTDNVLYVCDSNSADYHENVFTVKVGNIEVITVGGNVIKTNGNSCATATITNKLCFLYKKSRFSLNTNNVLTELSNNKYEEVI